MKRVCVRLLSKFVFLSAGKQRRKFAVSRWKRSNEQAVPHDLKIIRVSVSSFLCKVGVFEGGSFGRLDRDGGSNRLRLSAATRPGSSAAWRSLIPPFWDRIFGSPNLLLTFWPIAALPCEDFYFIFFCISIVLWHQEGVIARLCTPGKSDMKRRERRLRVLDRSASGSEHASPLGFFLLKLFESEPTFQTSADSMDPDARSPSKSNILAPLWDLRLDWTLRT